MEENPFENVLPIATDRVPDSAPISEVGTIMEGGIKVSNKEDLARLVEAPLLEACEILYDKNINTVMSSANATNIETGEAYIDIEFESLSPENQEIAKRLGQTFMMHGSVPTECVKLIFPISANSTVGDVRKMAAEIVSQFNQQDKIEIDYAERGRQARIAQQIKDIPEYKSFLEEWRVELKELEAYPTRDPERLAQLREDIPKLEEEIKYREELRDKQNNP